MHTYDIRSHKHAKNPLYLVLIADLGLFGVAFYLFIVLILHKTDVRLTLKNQKIP